MDNTPFLYCYPILGRCGLGNKLFPWSRAVICARKYGLKVLAPRWAQIRVGPLFRRERDKKFYIGLFTNKGYISGIKKLKVLFFNLKIKEQDFNENLFIDTGVKKSRVIVFSGLKDYFYDLKGNHDFLREELRKITESKWIEISDKFGKNFIVINIRRGDFVLSGVHTPLEWFIGVARRIRELSQLDDIPIKIISDGTIEELSPFLGVKNTELVLSLGSAIADILAMSNSSFLVASKGSTFSAWASFLGRMPTIYPPGSSPDKLFEQSENVFEDEYDPKFEFPELLKENLNLIKNKSHEH